MAIDKTRMHHQKSLTKTRKMQRELKNGGQRVFMFAIFNSDTGQRMGAWKFSGFDSEEAFVKADTWGNERYSFPIHAEEEREVL